MQAGDIQENVQPLRVGSLFSGVGGMDLGLEKAGCKVIWQCENNWFKRRVLQNQWPGMPLYWDIQTLPSDVTRPDILCGGFPCTDLSPAGFRAGIIRGSESSLFWDFLEVTRRVTPRWVLLENVAHATTSHNGRDFAYIIRGFTELGYGLQWRVLDSRYFGVPQKRRRVYIVGYLGGQCPRNVLFEPGGSSNRITTGIHEGYPYGFNVARGALVPSYARTITTRHGRAENDTFVVESAGIRRLTLEEQEKCQGFPPGWTFLSGKRERYNRQLSIGDACTVPVIEWIGRRIVNAEIYT